MNRILDLRRTKSRRCAIVSWKHEEGTQYMSIWETDSKGCRGKVGTEDVEWICDRTEVACYRTEWT